MEKAETRRVAMSIGFALTEAAQQATERERKRESGRVRACNEGSESVANGRAASACFDWLRHKFAINCSVVYTMKTLRIRHLVPGPGVLRTCHKHAKCIRNGNSSRETLEQQNAITIKGSTAVLQRQQKQRTQRPKSFRRKGRKWAKEWGEREKGFAICWVRRGMAGSATSARSNYRS